MSSGLMSCVRENSPPLDSDLESAGPLSLPAGNSSSRSHGFQGATTSTPIPRTVGVEDNISAANVEQQQQQQQQKRRRFHPLRNLRRIFRRRTINTADTAVQIGSVGENSPGPGSCNTLPPPASSSSEKNLRNIPSTAGDTVSASSPASPLTHQQLHDSYQTQSLPKSKSYGSHRDELLSVLLGKKRASKQQQQTTEQQPALSNSPDTMYTTTQRQQMGGMGVAVFPDAMSMSRSSYFIEKRHHQQRHQQLRSVGDSSQELSTEESLGATVTAVPDMSDSQRSLSEGRLLDVDVDGDYTRETLSQSHDSVFSESATASSLSIVLKAELTDVLRKRRNRPDASDEDLGLPRSPASPQRHASSGGGGVQSRSKAVSYNQPRVGGGHGGGHEVSSLSLLSTNSTDGEDAQQQGQHRQQLFKSSSEILRHPHVQDEEEGDAVGLERQRLSHAAAKHKMAIRPAKKKGPSRQHRRTLETSIPEANEELGKLGQTQQLLSPNMRALKDDTELKSKTRSLPPGSSLTAQSSLSSSVQVRTKTINETTKSTSSSSSLSPAASKNTTTTTNTSTSTSTATYSSTNTTTSSSSSSSSSHVFGLRSLTFKTPNVLGESSTDGDEVNGGEHGFLHRLMHRNSKRSIARANDGQEEDLDAGQNVAKKLQISTSCLEATVREPLSITANKSRSATSHEQHIQETRQSIKREINNEGKHGLNAMVSNFGTQPQPPTPLKPKSGPAARQRYLPQELGVPQLEKPLANSDSDVTKLLSKSSRGTDIFQSTALVREQTQLKESTVTTTNHFEPRKARIVGLSAFQQKLSRSSDSMGQHSSSSNSLETSTDEPSPLYYEEKQRKTVEKSRSFRNYQEEREEATSDAHLVHSNMPSLPDLSISFRVPATYYNNKQQQQQSPLSPRSPMSPGAKCASLGFEINDNKLLQARAESTGKLQHVTGAAAATATTPTRNSTTLLLSSSGAANISQIEQNIDLIVKSPMVNLLRKSGTVGEQLQLEATPTLPPQRPKVLELKQTNNIAIKDATPTVTAAHAPAPASTPIISPLAKHTKLSSSPPSRRNSTNVTSPTMTPTQPEFMKIQLNRVDQARIHNKMNHLVLAKNVKSATERSQSSDDLSMRRLSGESNPSAVSSLTTKQPTSANSPQQQQQHSSINQQQQELILGRQQRAVSTNSLRSSYVGSTGSSGSGSSEVLPVASPVTTPSTPIKKAVEATGNRFSLEERKRLFLNEDKSQAERKLVELRKERKKSINDELQRKVETVATTATPVTPATPTTPATPVTPATPATPATPVTPVTPGTPDSGNANVVVLRKKSFASVNVNSLPNVNPPAPVSGHEDATPELMKVFARRSLKVKDDDVVALAQIAVATHKKMSNSSASNGQSQSVDSDKENQSNSEEKLDKLATINEPSRGGGGGIPVQVHSVIQNRSSVADFRNLNNTNNNNQQKLSNLPPIKVVKVSCSSNINKSNNNSSSNHSNNNNISSNHNNNNVRPSSDRFSLKQQPPTVSAVTPATPTTPATTTPSTPATVAAVASPTAAATPTKSAIERSATVGEFKGIHQRRAEWEQRVKEALK